MQISTGRQRFDIRSYLTASTSSMRCPIGLCRCAVGTRKRGVVLEQQKRHSLPQVLRKHKRPLGLTKQLEELRHCEAAITRHANPLHPSPHLPNTQRDPKRQQGTLREKERHQTTQERRAAVGGGLQCEGLQWGEGCRGCCLLYKVDFSVRRDWVLSEQLRQLV